MTDIGGGRNINYRTNQKRTILDNSLAPIDWWLSFFYLARLKRAFITSVLRGHESRDHSEGPCPHIGGHNQIAEGRP